MPAVTILGAGVFGLSVAHALPRAYDVTIVARDMPGDPDSLDWASPWCVPFARRAAFCSNAEGSAQGGCWVRIRRDYGSRRARDPHRELSLVLGARREVPGEHGQGAHLLSRSGL
jgi:glycine/D-amino acid oxidase-like deaminating enzyme